MLHGKKILLGITGSIAAYKAAILVRLLVKRGAEVQVIMTHYAKDFITPLTMATLSQNPVLSNFYDSDTGEWNSHVDLGRWADIFIIAPVSANSMGKMANGVADNLLLATFLAAKCPVWLSPAMDLDMYNHPANQKNISILESFGIQFIEPAFGDLASGLTGKGRMEEPENITEKITDFFSNNTPLAGKKFLVTAGPTYEKIDPVRFIGNFSSGKMGGAIANSLAESGAAVELVTGPVTGLELHNSINRTDVVSTAEMFNTVRDIFPSTDGAILASAVSDYKPVEMHESKVKSSKDSFTLALEPTIDIAYELGKNKGDHLLAGFALETTNEIQSAKRKIQNKNFDFIVLNSLNDEGAGFQHDTNKVSIIDKSGTVKDFPLQPKDKVANNIVDEVIKKLALT